MKVKVGYYTVATKIIDVDDKFSVLTPAICENPSFTEDNLILDLCDIGWETVLQNSGDELLYIENLDGEILLEL